MLARDTAQKAAMPYGGRHGAPLTQLTNFIYRERNAYQCFSGGRFNAPDVNLNNKPKM